MLGPGVTKGNTMTDTLTGADLENALADRGIPSEGTADSKRAAVAAFDSEHAPPATTTLDNDVTKPSITAPGDGPADTTDPSETAYSVRPAPGDAARAAGTVNAVHMVPIPERQPRDGSGDRYEEYDATTPDGGTVRVRHNLETGTTRVIGIVVG